MLLPATLCKMQRKRRESNGFSKSTLMTPPGSHPTSGFGARHGPPKFFGHKKRRIVQNDAAKTKVSPVDIPTGLDPRANQSPTGALVASCGWPPFFKSSLGRHKKQNALPGYGRTFCFYGPRGIRTLDLSDANRTLSQQSRFCAHIMHCERRKINVYSSI